MVLAHPCPLLACFSGPPSLSKSQLKDRPPAGCFHPATHPHLWSPYTHLPSLGFHGSQDPVQVISTGLNRGLTCWFVSPTTVSSSNNCVWICFISIHSTQHRTSHVVSIQQTLVKKKKKKKRRREGPGLEPGALPERQLD